MNGWMAGWMTEWMDGWMDRWKYHLFAIDEWDAKLENSRMLE